MREPAIEIIHFSSVKASELADLHDELLTLSPNVRLRERDPGFQGNIDWALAALVAIWGAKDFVSNYVSSLAAEGTMPALRQLYRRIKDRSKWMTAAGKIRNGPALSIVLSDALAEQARLEFIFPATIKNKELTTALARVPTLVASERRRARRYFESPERVRGYVDRTVKFYFGENGRWKRVWPRRSPGLPPKL